MPEFPHLNLPFKVSGSLLPSDRRPNKRKQQQTVTNLSNRSQHGQSLASSAGNLLNSWDQQRTQRASTQIPLPNPNDIPVFLKVDTEVFQADSLTNWGIEIISEEQDGYIIGASVDNLSAFQKNVNQFLQEKGRYKDTAAKIWEFLEDDSWRVSQLLKGELGKIWESIVDTEVYTVELGISCYVVSKLEYPTRDKDMSDEQFANEVLAFELAERKLLIERDAKQMVRENEIEQYMRIYGGVVQDIWENKTDAVYFKVSITGNGLKDIVNTYQYLFEAQLPASYGVERVESSEILDDNVVELTAPPTGASKVCVIDSGIQEDHRLIRLAIDTESSRSYVDQDSSTVDLVRISGHGTKVAGTILYPYSIPTAGSYQLSTIIQNARILNDRNKISDQRFIPSLLTQIVADYIGTRIFNLSVAEDFAFSGNHMPALAGAIDKLTYENDLLFIIAAGNLFLKTEDQEYPGIEDHLLSGNNYPEYLSHSMSAIACPGVSFFGLTVGSISLHDFEDDDHKSIAGKDRVSPFSRTGLGMWGSLKPDVVEFGGDLILNKHTNTITGNRSTCPNVVNSTRYNASAVGNDYGTSFSTPKVSFIASMLQAQLPNEPAQMYRALIVQSARLPGHCINSPTLNDFRHYGYGVPSLNRALENSASRITLIQNGRIAPKRGDIYRVNIPDELRGEGRNFSLLVEVTLAFTAKTRTTRRGSHSYLSSWLEWQSTKYNERFEAFRDRVIRFIDQDGQSVRNTDTERDLTPIPWCIRENPAWTENGINRNNSTVQKSWAVIEPHRFANEFCISVISHASWDKNLEHEIPYSICISFEAVGEQIPVYTLISEAQIETEVLLETEVQI